MSKKKKSSQVVANSDAPVEMSALKISALTKIYGDLVALSPMDLSIPAGQSVALVGSNGSGKTTFLRLAAGLLDRTAGDIEIMGHEIGTIDARAQVSYIPDDPVLYDDLTVREHLQYLGPLYGAEDWESRSEYLLEKLGIAHRADDLPSIFSRGLRQKTSLAVGFLRPFSLLLIDEPFVGLDEPGRRALLDLLAETSEKGATVVIASHQLDLVKQTNRCIALSEGSITYDGDPANADLAALVGV